MMLMGRRSARRRRGDIEAFGRKEFGRQHAQIGLAHGDGEGFVGIGPEDG